MFIGAAIRNEKQMKRHRSHMRAILNQVKQKNTIEQIDLERKMSGSIIQKINTPPFQPKEIISGKDSPESEKVQNSINPKIRSRRKQYRHTERQSMINSKLDEIVKYAQMYPSHKNKSNFFKRTDEFLNMELEKSTSHRRKRRGGIIESKPLFNGKQEFLLRFDLVDQEGAEELERFTTTQRQKRNKVKEMMKKLRYFQCSDSIKESDPNYSMKAFIQLDMKELRIKKTERKTHDISSSKSFEQQKIDWHHSQGKEWVDIREENIRKVHQFIRGGQPLQHEEYSDFVQVSDIERYCEAFKIYDKMYQKIKAEVAREKINPKTLRNQTFKNTIFLKQNIKQEANMQRKKQIKIAMKRLCINQ